MDRETRKANIKKLQLPGSGAKIQQRKTRQTAKTAVGTSTISNYFPTPEKTVNQDKLKSPENLAPPPKPKTTRAKRTKLDAFIFQEPKTITKQVATEQICLNDDDFVVPEKKAKKAPQLASNETTQVKSTKPVKPSRRKKQTTIKSAFLRNEQLFAEIAAQHCAVDNFDGDDVQLAIALSKSEAESKTTACNENTPVDVGETKDCEKNAEEIRQQLEKYGFRTAEKKDYNTFAAAFMPKANGRRQKSKWANKFTALTLRDEQVQHKKLLQKIENLLNQQYRTQIPKTEEKLQINYQLQSSLLRKCKNKSMGKILHDPEDVHKPHEHYFVVELFEVSKLSPGHLLKDWKTIQGRDLSPKKQGPLNEAMELKLKKNYVELEEFFKLLKSTNRRIDSEVETVTKSGEVKEINLTGKLKTGDHVTPNNTDNDCYNKMPNSIRRNYFNAFQDIDPPDPSDNSSTSSTGKRLIQLMPPTKSLDLMQVSDTSIRTEAATYNSTEISNSNITHNSETTVLSETSVVKALSEEVKQSSFNLDIKQVSNTTNINSTQKTRSNSPDLFADSDMEIEENDNVDEGGDAANNINVNKGNTSNDNIAGVTTYEIYSSDEVKNTSLSEVPDQLTPVKENQLSPQYIPKENVIDLTQDDEEEKPLHGTLNCSKPIVEIDLFADSPLDDEEPELSTDINSNTQKTKYSTTKADDSFKLTLSFEVNGDGRYASKENKEDSLKCILSLETNTNDDEHRDQTDLKTVTVDTKKKHEDDLFQLSLSQEEDNVVLRDMAVNQTNNSFLNFQGSNQLATSFHRETATGTRVEYTKPFAGNNTIFHELYNKYMGNVAATQDQPQSIRDAKTFRKSISQNLPIDKNDDQEIRFGIDIESTLDRYMSKRKSLSFNAKTPENISHSINAGLSKSHSFTEQNISIDLTQNDEDEASIGLADEEEDDDCLVLSDDEINYSIWKANKTNHFADSKENSDSEDAINMDDLKPLTTSYQESELDTSNKKVSPNKNVNFSQSSYTDFEIQSPKKQDAEHKLERSNFGIMEEFSEPIDFTPNFITPTKVLSEASFLQSPPEELSAPIKRFSVGNKSTKKFNDLLRSVDKEIAEYYNTDEYDAFDYLTYENQLTKTKTANVRLPQDFEQLMTAEISFKESPEKSTESKGYLSASDINNIEKVQSTSLTVKSYQTPTKFSVDEQQLTINNKTYIIRSCDSVKPNYTQYSESELLKELYNYGIKPLKRKQAVKMLEYIYNQTHPLIVDEPVSVDVDLNVPTVPKCSKSPKHAFTKSSQSKTISQSSRNISTKAVQAIMKENVADTVSNKLDLHDGCGLDMLRYSQDLQAELVSEQYILQTNVTKKTPQPLMPFHIAWYNLLCSNHKLHENILMYEPIDLQEIYLFLKGLGYRYDPKDLKQFFDNRCIIFRYDLAAGSNGNKEKQSNRHVRKKKKTH